MQKTVHYLMHENSLSAKRFEVHYAHVRNLDSIITIDRARHGKSPTHTRFRIAKRVMLHSFIRYEDCLVFLREELILCPVRNGLAQ